MASPLSTDPSALHSEPFIYSLGSSPHSSYHNFDHLGDTHPNKLGDPAPVIVPSQSPFFSNPSSPSCHPITVSYPSPHTGLPVQHTDDAASKEAQYLRRRCFNCHTTEDPSRRCSTLNPGNSKSNVERSTFTVWPTFTNLLSPKGTQNITLCMGQTFSGSKIRSTSSIAMC